jgi:hypothetical protein
MNKIKPYSCKYCGESCPDKFSGTSKCSCRRCTKAKYKADKKKFAVEYKGGKCEICGYDKSYKAMDFHHTNPTEKDRHISRMMDWSRERIKKELDKCILLCANCHREEHEKIENSKFTFKEL